MTNLYAQKTDVDYENFIAECPYCSNRNIFNRASDLKTFRPISCRRVQCAACKRKFHVKSDAVSEKHAYLIYDCSELLRQKRYMYCIINLSTACEAFFVKGIETKLLWEPWRKRVFNRDTEVFNRCARKLERKIKTYCYSQLLNVFLDVFVPLRSFQSVESIERYLDQMGNAAAKNPKNKEIRNYPDHKTRELLLQLKGLTVNRMRNQVAHKYAFRPTRQDAEKHLEEVRFVLLSLQTGLGLKHKQAYIN